MSKNRNAQSAYIRTEGLAAQRFSNDLSDESFFSNEAAKEFIVSIVTAVVSSFRSILRLNAKKVRSVSIFHRPTCREMEAGESLHRMETLLGPALYRKEERSWAKSVGNY